MQPDCYEWGTGSKTEAFAAGSAGLVWGSASGSGEAAHAHPAPAAAKAAEAQPIEAPVAAPAAAAADGTEADPKPATPAPAAAATPAVATAKSPAKPALEATEKPASTKSAKASPAGHGDDHSHDGEAASDADGADAANGVKANGTRTPDRDHAKVYASKVGHELPKAFGSSAPAPAPPAAVSSSTKAAGGGGSVADMLYGKDAKAKQPSVSETPAAHTDAASDGVHDHHDDGAKTPVPPPPPAAYSSVMTEHTRNPTPAPWTTEESRAVQGTAAAFTASKGDNARAGDHGDRGDHDEHHHDGDHARDTSQPQIPSTKAVNASSVSSVSESLGAAAHKLSQSVHAIVGAAAGAVAGVVISAHERLANVSGSKTADPAAKDGDDDGDDKEAADADGHHATETEDRKIDGKNLDGKLADVHKSGSPADHHHDDEEEAHEEVKGGEKHVVIEQVRRQSQLELTLMDRNRMPSCR